MKKLVFISMALFLAVAMATSASAFGWGRSSGAGAGGCGAPCVQGGDPRLPGVDLTADQKTKFKEMRDAQFKELQPIREQMLSRRDELRKLWLEPNPDQAKIAAAQKEIRTLRDQVQDKTTAFRLEALKVLTPEQKEKLKAFATCRELDRRHGFGPGEYGRGACQGYGPRGRGNW